MVLALAATLFMLVICGAESEARIVMVSTRGTLDPASFEAVSKMLKIPGLVGVPTIAPVDELSARPSGSPSAV